MHRNLAVICLTAIDHAKRNSGKSTQWFAKWPRRKQSAVAEATRAVNHADFDVSRHCEVLQAIVGDQHVGRKFISFKKQHATSIGASACDGYRRAAASVDQARLVTNDCGIAVIGNAHRRNRTASIATRNHARIPTAFAQSINQRKNQRRLAAASNGEIADDDDRYGQALR